MNYTMGKRNYNFIFELEKYFSENPEQLYNSIALTERNNRLTGKKYSLNDHTKALILAKLSNRQKWFKIENNIDKIQNIFLDFDANKILQTNENDIIAKIKHIKCGTQVTDRDFNQLHQNIRILLLIDNKFNSIDDFVTSKPAHEIVNLLSEPTSKFKMQTIGPALAWEYIRNVGIDGAKPDVHLKRILSSNRLNFLDSNSPTDEDFHKTLEDIKLNTGKALAEIDNLLWSFCASGYAEICTSTPQCHKCPINNYCNQNPTSIIIETFTSNKSLNYVTKNSIEMSTADKIKTAFANTSLNTEFTSSEITKRVQQKFGKITVCPADYCYNRINVSVNLDKLEKNLIEKKCLFEYIEKDKYIYRGPNYNYNGKILHSPKQGREHSVGELKNGVLIRYTAI